MAIKFKSLKIDPIKETGGIWVDSFVIEGLRLKVRSIEVADYQKACTMEAQRLLRKYSRSDVPVDEMAELRGRLLAKHILVGWEGLDTPYTEALALETLCDPEFRKLCDAVESASKKAAELDLEFVDDLVKN